MRTCLCLFYVFVMFLCVHCTVATTEQISDFMQKLMQAFFAKEDKEAKLKEALTVSMPAYFATVRSASFYACAVQPFLI